MSAAVAAATSAMASGKRSISSVVVMAVVGILLVGLCVVVPVADAATQPKCKGTFQSDGVVLCHIPGAKSIECLADTGFVVGDLFIAPQSEYKKDCNSFHNNNLLNASCLRESAPQYDEVVFDILEKASGRQKIDSVVERLYFQNEDNANDSSVFVAFANVCKPVKKTKSASVLNMCHNATVSDFRVYLTLQDTSDIPSDPSLCRCTVQPTKNLEVDLKPLDLRLQNVYDNQQCGTTALQITSGGSSPVLDIPCRGKEALHGLHKLYSSKSKDEITLTLTSVNSTNFPTAVWIEINQEYVEDAEFSVTCEGFVPLPTVVDSGGEDGGDDGDSGKPEEDGEEGGGANLPIIIGPVVGLIVLLIIIILFIVFMKRRNTTGRDFGTSSSICCCWNREKKPYLAVNPHEPIYAEAGGPSYQHPVDAKYLANGRPEYAEPVGGTLRPGAGLPLVPTTTPPPLPDEPCPASPPPTGPASAQPPMTFDIDNPPPKPERTLLRKPKDSGSEKTPPKEEEDGEYDHIPNGKMDGKNNNLRQNGRDDGGTNVYSHLDHGSAYSHVGLAPKTAVKDNIYDTTS